MTYIVTGATSFIGSKFILSILDSEKNCTVYAVVRPESSNISNLPSHPNLKIVFEDINKIKSLSNIISKADVFINFAWEGSSHKERNSDEINNRNIKNSVAALECASALGCELFVETGSQAEYGYQDGLISESAECNPFSAYGKAKLQTLIECSSIARKLRIRYLHFRIFSIYGEKDHDYTLFKTCLSKMRADQEVCLTECKQNWNFLYVDDAAAIMLDIVRKANNFIKPGNTEIINIGSKDTRPLYDYIFQIKEILNSRSILNFGSIRVDRLLSIDPDVSKMMSIIGQDFKIKDFKEGVELSLKREKTAMGKVKEKSINTRHNCLLCGTILPESPLMSFDNMPASAQDIPNSDQIDSERGIKLNLYQCPACSLVQLDANPVEYYKNVIRAGGGSSTMKNLRISQYRDFIERFDLKGKRILEVGCGRGEFLSMWNGFDVNCMGIENSSELVEIGKKNGLNIIQGFMDDPCIRLQEGPFEAFCQFNFLEHQPRPNEMLKAIYNNLTPDGVGLVTVPSLEYILKYNGYYELIRDHLAYYSESSLRQLFERNGFEVVSLKTVNRDTLEIQVKKRKSVDISNWIQGYDQLYNEIIDFINSNGGETSIWGASHQGFTLIPSMHLEPYIKYIIDSAPFKQGKVSPASHIPIVSPKEFSENPTSSIIIVAPGYTEEIANCIRKEFGDTIVIATLRSDHLEIIQ